VGVDFGPNGNCGLSHVVGDTVTQGREASLYTLFDPAHRCVEVVQRGCGPRAVLHRSDGVGEGFARGPGVVLPGGR
jgi:hypothetical protein